MLGGGDVNGGDVVSQVAPLSGWHEVQLVLHVEARLFVGFEFAENDFDLGILLGGGEAAGIGDLEDQRRALDLLERGAEGGDERVRQAADESDRIREKDLAL